MAIFSVLGIALISLLRQSTGFLEKGQAGSEVLDILENADRQFAEDFLNVTINSPKREGTPDVRFFCDRLAFDTDGDSIPDIRTPRLCFVRSIQGEASDPLLRAAGRVPGAGSMLDGEDDATEAGKGDLKAAGGKQEVAWILVPGKKDDDPGVMTLYRGVRMPVVGGEKSLLPAEVLTEPRKVKARVGITSAREAQERLRPVLTGVLFLSYRFWSRHSRPEASRLVMNGRLVDELPPERGGGGLSPTWDSTRGILPVGGLPDQFFLGRGPASRDDAVDDVFPSRVRLTLVVDRIGTDAKTGELAEGIGPDDKTLTVSDTRFAPGGDPVGKFLKIGTEWMRWSERDGRTFSIEERGARGTKKQSHGSADVVRAGATLVRDFTIPAFREDWND